MRLKTVRSGGWWPSAIASMIRGDRKPSRSNRRTERLSICSRRAISSTEFDLFRDQLEHTALTDQGSIAARSFPIASG
jgi:hypothetical protein